MMFIENKSDQEIINSIGMANLPRIIYYLYRKHHGEYELIDVGGDCAFRFGNKNIANVSYLAVHMHFLRIEEDEICMEGNVSWPAVFKDLFKLYIKKNDQKYKTVLVSKGLDVCTDDGDTFETRDTFRIRIPLDELSINEITFVYECDGIYAESGKINSMRFMPIADIVLNQYAYINGWIVRIKEGKILVAKDDSEKLRSRFFEYNYLSLIDNKRVVHLRKEHFRKLAEKERAIWLFMDRLEKADDNGEAFFRFVSRRKDIEADCFFIISDQSSDYNRLKKYGNVVSAFSSEHLLLLLEADYIFTSQLNGWIENPYGIDVEYFRDLYHHAKVVFLQHGVTKDNHSKWLNRYKQDLYGLVTSSPYEMKAFLGCEYDYSKNVIWNVGMPRFDRLEKKERKYVLIMPTWRRSVMHLEFLQEVGAHRWILNQGEDKNIYFKRYKRLLNNDILKRMCHKAGYEILFMAHPLLQDYISLFDIPNDICVKPYSYSWRKIFAESALMITDYSSVAFDFAYLKRPVIYYQFDKESFFAGHTYQEGYFDYNKMAFGPVVDLESQLLEKIDEFLYNDCRMLPEHSKRVDDFFSYNDGKCCERLLQRVINK